MRGQAFSVETTEKASTEKASGPRRLPKDIRQAARLCVGPPNMGRPKGGIRKVGVPGLRWRQAEFSFEGTAETGRVREAELFPDR